MLFGPAYKGIPLATATAVALRRTPRPQRALCFNRKEAKDHGEGGRIVGAPLAGPRADRGRRDHRRHRGARVARAHPRRRRAPGRASRSRSTARSAARATLTAVQEVEQQHGLKCVSIVTLADLIEALAQPADGRARISAEQLTALRAYRAALRRSLSLPAAGLPPEICTHVRRATRACRCSGCSPPLSARCGGLRCAHAAAPGQGGSPTSWVDEQGVVHYGDSIPPQYAAAGTHGPQHAGRGGRARRRAEDARAAGRRGSAGARAGRCKQKQHDSFLLSTYTSVKDIEALRDVRLDQLRASAPPPSSTSRACARAWRRCRRAP